MIWRIGYGYRHLSQREDAFKEYIIKDLKIPFDVYQVLEAAFRVVMAKKRSEYYDPSKHNDHELWTRILALNKLCEFNQETSPETKLKKFKVFIEKMNEVKDKENSETLKRFMTESLATSFKNEKRSKESENQDNSFYTLEFGLESCHLPDFIDDLLVVTINESISEELVQHLEQAAPVTEPNVRLYDSGLIDLVKNYHREKSVNDISFSSKRYARRKDQNLKFELQNHIYFAHYMNTAYAIFYDALKKFNDDKRPKIYQFISRKLKYEHFDIFLQNTELESVFSPSNIKERITSNGRKALQEHLELIKKLNLLDEPFLQFLEDNYWKSKKSA